MRYVVDMPVGGDLSQARVVPMSKFMLSTLNDKDNLECAVERLELIDKRQADTLNQICKITGLEMTASLEDIVKAVENLSTRDNRLATQYRECNSRQADMIEQLRREKSQLLAERNAALAQTRQISERITKALQAV